MTHGTKKLAAAGLALLLGLSAARAEAGRQPTPGVTPRIIMATATPSPAPEATATPVAMPTPIPTLTPAPTATLAPTATPAPAFLPFQMGARGEAVSDLQERLAALGYYSPQRVDGDFGAMTRDALIAFQQANDLPVTGAADQLTQSVLYGASPRRYALPAEGALPSLAGSASGDVLYTPTATASGSLSENYHGRMLDYDPNWVLNDEDSKPWAVHNAGGWIALTLSGKRLIGGFIIRNGYQLDARRYNNNHRPKTLNLYADEALIGSVTLRDVMGNQCVQFANPVLAETIRFEIASVYESNQDNDTCITALRLTGAQVALETEPGLGTARVALGNPDFSLKLRAAPSDSAGTLAELPHGAHVTLLGYEGDWARVRVNGQIGYVRASYLESDS